MTLEIFRDDAYARSCNAMVINIHETGIELDSTVFYCESGGQPGDIGTLSTTSGISVDIVDTQRDKVTGRHLHIASSESVLLKAGDIVTASINWERRYRLMRMHSGLHLLCGIVDAQVTGAKVDADNSRIDFNPEGIIIDKSSIQEAVDELIAKDLPLSTCWITEQELREKPDMVRTMSVRPPIGIGNVRLVEIEGLDLQPCGGTHVASTAEIGRLVVSKIENKGKHNRRINILLTS